MDRLQLRAFLLVVLPVFPLRFAPFLSRMIPQ